MKTPKTSKAQLKANAKWRAANKSYAIKISKKWRKKNKKYVHKWMRDRSLGLHGPFSSLDGPNWKKQNREHYLKAKRESTNKRRKEIFLEALTHYSQGTPKCYCCGETVLLLLALDHINGGGNKHRKEVGGHVYMWAKKNKWPKLFRVACHSCNMGAHLNGGICPHKEIKKCTSQKRVADAHDGRSYCSSQEW